MIRVQTLHQLKKHPHTTDIVHVKSVNKMYRCEDGEWTERAYYSPGEVAAILGIQLNTARNIMRRLGFRPSLGNNPKIRLNQLAMMAKVVKIRKEEPCLKYSEIKKRLMV